MKTKKLVPSFLLLMLLTMLSFLVLVNSIQEGRPWKIIVAAAGLLCFLFLSRLFGKRFFPRVWSDSDERIDSDHVIDQEKRIQ